MVILLMKDPDSAYTLALQEARRQRSGFHDNKSHVLILLHDSAQSSEKCKTSAYIPSYSFRCKCI